MRRLEYLRVRATEPLPTPQELFEQLSVPANIQKQIEDARNTVRDILSGKDSRFLIIVGPCSIHDPKAAKEYAQKLVEIAERTKGNYFIMMRVYFEKPRTAKGWKGILHDPWLNGSHDIATGLKMTRQLLLDLAEMGIPTAAEILDPTSAWYFGDLLSWSCIGARTSASQTHRQMASLLSTPVGFKNSTDGNVEVAINGIVSASSPHVFIGMDNNGRISRIQTKGNPDGHVVLRGGHTKTNYDPQSISHTIQLLKKAKLTPHLLIDCSHDNSLKQYEKQAQVFQSVLHQVIEGNSNIRGVLLESNLNAGSQTVTEDTSKLRYAVSLTDACIGWEMTEKLLLWGEDFLKRNGSPDYSSPSLTAHA